MEEINAPIGIIDSGVGGISVLKELKRVLPMESYLYLSDVKNAPYGTKSEEEIFALTENAVKKLLLYPCKLIVIACNTATAVAAEGLRKKYCTVPIVGLEPAVTPAVREFKGKNILVLTTDATEKTERFKMLISRLSGETNITTLSAQKTVSFVESGLADRGALLKYLQKIFLPYNGIKFSAVVLGCTHFPFARSEIEAALGYSTCFYDGSCGAAKRVYSLLSKSGKIQKDENVGVTLWLEKGFSTKGRKIIKMDK